MAGSKGQGGMREYAFGEGDRGARGPVGADGGRPLLGMRGRDPLAGAAGAGHAKGNACVPTWDGKGPQHGLAKGGTAGSWGASRGLGAKGGTKGGVGCGGDMATATDGNGGRRRAWARPQPVHDEDGYQLVQPRRIYTDKGGPKGGEASSVAAPKGGGDGQATTTATRRLWSDEDSDDDWGPEDDDEGGDGGDGEVQDAEAVPDPGQLRRIFEEYAKTVRDLEKRGSHGPALETLRQARDAAEENWRRAKAPAPLPKRLDWAEAKLRKAQAALTRVRLELDRFDEETDRRREELLGKIREAESWHEWRKQQLDDIHTAAADRAPGRRGGGAEQ